MKRRRLPSVVAWAILAVAVAGCLPAAATAEGRDIGALYGGFIAIAAVVAAIVFGLTTWSIIRYRRRPGDGLPPQITGSWRLEALWTGLPVLTVLGLFAATLVVLGAVSATSDHPGARIRVEAFRWGWTFTYPDDGVRISGIGGPGPEIEVPVGEPILITIASADVAHAFYVPQFLFKRDAIPGRESSFQFTVQDPGTYRGQCAEFCGLEHAKMALLIIAEPEDKFRTWYDQSLQAAAMPADSERIAGRRVFLASSCAMCHTIGGTGAGATYGPDLTHFGSRLTLAAGTRPNTTGNLAGWIVDPQQIKPGSKMPPNNLAAKDLRALVAYLQGLK